MNVIIDKFVRFYSSIIKSNLTTFYSIKIGRRIRVRTLEKIISFRNSQRLQKEIVCGLSMMIDEFVRFYSSIIKSIWKPSIGAKSFVDFEFEH